MSSVTVGVTDAGAVWVSAGWGGGTIRVCCVSCLPQVALGSAVIVGCGQSPVNSSPPVILRNISCFTRCGFWAGM